MVSLLWRQEDLPQLPLSQPLGALINAILNMDLQAQSSREAMYPKTDSLKVIKRLIHILQRSLSAYAEDKIGNAVTPLMSVLHKLSEDAPDEVKQYMRDSLLPTADDRAQILGRGETVPARLLKNATNPYAPQLGDIILHLLFDLSDRDSSKFVENVGYGYASGFLFKNNVAVPGSMTTASSLGDASGTQRLVNPITGQFLDQEGG